MKRMMDLSKFEKGIMTLLTGLNLGLAIIVAPFIALGTSIDSAVRWVHKHAA